MTKKISGVKLLVFLGLFGCRQDDKLLLNNDGFLVVSDSISIPIDSLTIPNSNSFSYKDSLLIIPNEGINTISILNIATLEHNYHDFGAIKRDIKMSAAWLMNKDSLFVYEKKKQIIYLVNDSLAMLDSFLLKRHLPPSEKIVGPAINISTSQVPHFFDKRIYYSGISIGENLGEKRRYVIGEIAKDTVKYYVPYPKDYEEKNLGGIYYRITYHTIVEDSLIHISFPASNYIAIFNISNKQVLYKELYPKISDRIIAFSKSNQREVLSKNQSEILKHFYGQFSFKEIIYDSYRKIFYRFLIMPGKDSDIEKKIFGKQYSYILIYDKSYNYLGCKLLDLNVRHDKFFVTSKGLYLFKNTKDENTLHFYLYTVTNK